MWFFIFAIALVGAMLLGPKPKPQNRNAAGLSELNINTTSADRTIPYVAGKDLYKGSNGFWYGDLQTTAITKKVKTGLFSSKRQVIAHKYELGLALGLCYGPGVTIHELRFGDKKGWEGSITGDGATINVNKPQLFGKEDEEGGVVGTVTLYTGSDSQSPDSYLESQLTDVPAYRGLSYLVFTSGFYWGNSPTIPMVNVVLSRYPDPLNQGANATIGEDANPAYMLYELMTSKLFGVGIEPGQINTASVTALGQTLYSEGLGLTFVFDSALTGEDAIEQILRHINGSIYTSLETGLVELDITREENPEELPVVTDANIKFISGFNRAAIDSLNTELKVRYVDRAENYQRAIAPAVNTGARFLLGRPSVQEMPYYGIRTRSLANQIAWRDLVTISSALAQARIVTNRSTFGFRRGSAFVLNSEKYNRNMVCRVVGSDYGTLTDNTITLDVAEDQFAFGASVFANAPDSGFTPIVTDPEEVVTYLLEEMPYYFLINNEIDPASLMVFAEPPGGAYLSFDLLLNEDSGGYFEDALAQPFAQLAALGEDISYVTSEFDVVGSITGLEDVSAPDIKLTGQNLAILIDDTKSEWIAYTSTSIAGSTITLQGVKRALLDRVPKEFNAANSVIWFVDTYAMVEKVLGTTANITLKMLTTSLQGQIAEGDVTGRSITLANRSAKPYPVRDVQINGTSFPSTVIEGESGLVFTWKGSNKESDIFLYQDDAHVAPPASTVYNLVIYNDSTDAVMHTENGLTAHTFTFEFVDEGPVYSPECRVEIETVVDGVAAEEIFVMPYSRPDLLAPTGLAAVYKDPVAPTDLSAANT